MRSTHRFVACLLGALALTACGGTGAPATLAITSPADESVFGAADDVDPGTPGVQILVSVTSSKVDEGEALYLFLDASAVADDPTTPPDATGAIAADGTAQVALTVPTGTFHVQACVRELCGVRSNVVQVTVVETPRCEIVSPDPAAPYLNADDDVDAAPGFQTDVRVVAAAGTAGHTVRLVIDGEEAGAPSATATVAGDGSTATLGGIELEEGRHTVYAACELSDGSVVNSAPAAWEVDITPCVVTLDAPGAGELFTDLDDVSGDPGIQIAAQGSVAGAGCEALFVDTCSAIDAASERAATASFDVEVTLGTGATQSVCARVVDEAGNVGDAEVEIRVRTEAPAVAITAPTSGTTVNLTGEGADLPDANDATPRCDVAFTVDCEAGLEVELLDEPTETLLATAACPTAGMVTVEAPLLTGQSSHTVVARQRVDGLVGTSAAVTLDADCEPPALSVVFPTCGAVLRPSMDDMDPATDGFQYRVTVDSPNAPPVDVTLVIEDGAGTETFRATVVAADRVGTLHVFENADFDLGGEMRLVATAADAAGNVGTAPDCTVTVADLPTLEDISPATGTVYDADNWTAADCDAATGLQVLVTATTDADAGATATVTVAGGAPVVATLSGGSLSACVDVPRGTDIPIEVAVTDPVAGTIRGTVRVTVDTVAPPVAIEPLTGMVADVRDGALSFEWDAVADDDGGNLSRYELRCSEAALDSEARWDAASPPMGVLPVPAASGATQNATVRGFRPGVTVSCAIRGYDAAGNETPLPSAPTAITPDLRMQPVSPAFAGAGVGEVIAGVGDVNGDGFADVLAQGTNTVWLVFGAADPSAGLASARINGPAGAAFGGFLGGLGDVNGDGRPDFAIGAAEQSANRGAVYVFLGRAAADPWPMVTTLSVADCQADLCLRGSDPDLYAGWGVEPAGDFDGDGTNDVAVGASGFGQVFVLLGRSSWSRKGSGMDGLVISLPADDPDGFVIEGDAASYFGNAFTALPDARGSDGRSELVVEEYGGAEARLYMVDGRAYPAATTGLVTVPAGDVRRIVSDLTLEAGHGYPVRSLGDFNGDGRPDFASYNNIGGARGGPTVYYGMMGGDYQGAQSVRFQGGSADQLCYSTGLGWAPTLGRVGDIDGDGLGDVVCGADESSDGSGEIVLLYGRNGASGVVARQNFTTFAVMRPPTTETFQNRRGAFAGDINGDGHFDLLLGDPQHDGGNGRIVVYY